MEKLEGLLESLFFYPKRFSVPLSLHGNPYLGLRRSGFKFPSSDEFFRHKNNSFCRPIISSPEDKLLGTGIRFHLREMRFQKRKIGFYLRQMKFQERKIGFHLREIKFQKQKIGFYLGR